MELIPAPFADLVTRLFEEPALQDGLFELPRRRWYQPPADGPDLGVQFHGRPAGNALGPAAGPHTQMAQNLLLSYLSGSRILELKTVQIDDRLSIPRPCIDLTTIGYNVEWSQELLVLDSLREYVAGSMLLEMFRQVCPHGGAPWQGSAGDWLFDLSVGYDLAGIRSAKVGRFLEGMRDAGSVVEHLRGQIPAGYKVARDLDYPTRLSDSVTLSTFHGCPADEIEGISEFLIAEHDFDVIVKMNPPMLGQERLEHILHDVLGYTDIRVNPKAYTSGLAFDESLELAERLGRFAADRGRGFGFKFSNTLEVINHRDFFTPDNEIMYLSGQPLYVITLTLTDIFRQAVGPDVPITFSAGIDQFNVAEAVACGFAPITVSSDLLRPGGYGRLPAYLKRLCGEIQKVGARTIDDFILKAHGQEAEARRRATASGVGDDPKAILRWAGLLNTACAAEAARNEPRYRADNNSRAPKRIDSHLTTFDCITCDKCLPVCPNAANFTYPTPAVSFDYLDTLVAVDGSHGPVSQQQHFEIEQAMQIACYADFCNECGNCDTFCPEYGGPYIKKPTLFGTLASWRQAGERDGFVIGHDADGGGWIHGRYKGCEVQLTFDATSGHNHFDDGVVETVFDASDHLVVRVQPHAALSKPHVVKHQIYYTLHHLRIGITDPARINQVNAAWAGGV